MNLPNCKPQTAIPGRLPYPKDYRSPLERQLQDIRQTLADLGRHLTDSLTMSPPNPTDHPPQANF